MKYTKLLLVSPTFYPTHGGAELRFLRYLPLFNKNGIHVTVITGTPKRKKFSGQDHSADWRNKKNGVLVSEFEIDSAKILQYKLPEQGAAERSKILLDKVIECCAHPVTRPDVMQILSPLSVKTVGRLRKIKAMGIPIVFSYSIAHEFSGNVITNWLQRQKIRYVYKNFSCIIVASKVLAAMVKKIDPNARLEVIPNGVDTSKFSPVIDANEKEQLRSYLGFPKNATIICLVGAIHPRKGTDLLIRAWSNLTQEFADLHLLLIGPRYDREREDLRAFKNEIEAAIANSARIENIHFTGQVENVNEYLKASDLFVFPSRKEGMPNAVLEAMATGLPTVLTPFIGLPEDLGKPEKEYLLVKRTENSIARGIETILNDSAGRLRLAGNARAWVENTMDLNASAKLHAEVYHSFTS